MERPNVLVVCGRNKRRSRTAEYIFKNDSRFNIRSVGLSFQSERKITEKDLTWSNSILVMEKNQKNKIREIYNFLELPKIEVLDIPDEFDYLDPELVEILTTKINLHLHGVYNI